MSEKTTSRDRLATEIAKVLRESMTGEIVDWDDNVVTSTQTNGNVIVLGTRGGTYTVTVCKRRVR